jgi:predicted DNA-binding protein (MmcQ/YjbR family)
MNIEEYRTYCIKKKGVTEGFPFDKNTLVFKVGGKMFALSNVDNFNSINLKCNPELSLELREQYEGIKPGYHMNKKHWNTVLVNEELSDEQIIELTKHSYDLVLAKLPKKK